MAVTAAEIRSGSYYDSAFLMQLQKALLSLPGILDAGVVMGTASNKEMLAHINLNSGEVSSARADDLVIVVRGEDTAQAQAALEQVDQLLKKRTIAASDDYRPRSLETAVQANPSASWVLISVAGRYAASLARQAIRLGKHVFLFSDNVPVEAEIGLKQAACAKGLLVMGPDCGTALIHGVCMGFANQVTLGSIGVVAAAGTGLQHLTSRIHQLGGGVSYGIGTGGRDLSEQVGALTFLQGLDVLRRDPDTRVITLLSKPPAPGVAARVLQAAEQTRKPVVINFIGWRQPEPRRGNLHFAASLDEAARLAVELAQAASAVQPYADPAALPAFAPGQRYLRALYSGGTLAYEAQAILQDYLPRVWSNAPLNKENRLANSWVSQEHTILDLGEDEFTVGRLHPMMDNELRIRRLLEEAGDPSVAVVILDLVLGYGSHLDPANEIAPAIYKARQVASGHNLHVLTLVSGTDGDPQNFEAQIQQLNAVGVQVYTDHEQMVRQAGRLLQSLLATETTPGLPPKPVDLAGLQQPLQAINIGLQSFAGNLQAQGVPTIDVDWRPPAGGNEHMIAILEKMRGDA